MVEIISSVERTARKDHEDSAGVWIRNCLSDIRNCGELTFGELRSIAKLMTSEVQSCLVTGQFTT